MNNQLNFWVIGWKKKVLKSERFLKEMNAVAPWKRLTALVDPNPLNTSDVSMKGDANQDAAGFIYARNSAVVLTYNGNIGNLGIVANTFSVSGNKTFGALDPDRAPDANWKVALVE